jgi:hypothetical protein
VNLRVRRSLVIGVVAASLALGVVSIRVAARLAAADAPPPAPPISMAELTQRLQDEQARAASLQSQLDDLNGVTEQLRTALAGTADQVSLDGLSADQLRSRLKKAEGTLAEVTALLAAAQARLAALGASTGGGASSGGGGGGGGASNPTPAPAGPTPRPTSTGFTLSLSIVAGDVKADWSVCGSSGFDSYALVRSTKSEIHWPPEDDNTQVARISSNGTTSFTDGGAPSGKSWYRVYCLVSDDGEIKTSRSTSTVSITVP